MALDSGSAPVFFYNHMAEPFLPYLGQLSAFIPTDYLASVPSYVTSWELGISSAELSRAWGTTQTFCSLVNFASDSMRKIPQETYLNSMASVMYRLLHLKFAFGTLDEILRLSLLGFCSHTFLQWSLVKLPHRHLSVAFKECLLGSLGSPVAIPPHTLVWILSTGLFALFPEEDNDWLLTRLKATLDACGSTHWSLTRGTLKRHLWMDFIHDPLGRRMIESVWYMA